MLKAVLGWFVKIALQMIFWVFIFSINWKGRSLYDRTYEIVVENPLVESIEDELYSIWNKVVATAHKTYADFSNEQKKRLR